MITNTDITAEIFDAAYGIHKSLGPGCWSPCTSGCSRGSSCVEAWVVESQVSVSFEYDGPLFDGGLTLDLLVNECVVVELKAVEKILPVHRRQTFTSIRLLDVEVALVLNFGAARVTEGTRRIVNHYRSTAHSALRINSRDQNA